MYLPSDPASSQQTAEERPEVPADLTYAQVVQNLAEHAGTHMTRAHLSRMSRIAESGLDSVLQAYSTTHT